ncbi:unnamed protein product, partial [Brenthis ino]
MNAIATYVFFDLETTGLPRQEHNKTKITELSLVAVKKEHLLDSPEQKVPRVQNKLTLCLNPQKMIQDETTTITGLNNDLLEHQSPFNENAFRVINGFLNILKKPICLVAYNGNWFDFPILKRQLDNLNVTLPEEVMCADSFFCYYDILYTIEKSQNSMACTSDTILQETNEEKPNNDNIPNMQSINESTPKNIINNNNSLKMTRVSKARRRLPWSKGDQPRKSYKLTDVYNRLFGCCAKDSHTAEGLLLLTGLLWGCTNPFIRQGTRGLCKVRADSILGLAYAETMFLLGNWKYMVPWLINQSGSLVYLIAVQQVPLSLAVPAANSLAFAFTALTGAAIGAEEPLDGGSSFGVVLIGIGTALCCWDKT